MNGDKKTFTRGKMFYKEYTDQEFLFLKMLHGENNLHLDTITEDYSTYIEMPKGPVISIDTIPRDRRHTMANIIAKSLPFMLEQVALLNALGIYYSDCMQWLYHNNKLHLIDFDAASFRKINYQFNNYDLLINFLAWFHVCSEHITESLRYLGLMQTQQEDIEDTFYTDEEKAKYKELNDPTMVKNHIYYSRNNRHIQIGVPHIHIYGKTGNMVIAESILNPAIAREWELVRIV